MTLIRTFHPIGQGAFYTERHKINEDEFTVVYDCGSTTLNQSKLEKKIKSTFPKSHCIDILFISHFHADHINGIRMLSRHCTIKRVVIPLVDESSKTLLKIANLIENDYLETTLVDNPEEFFGDDIIVITIDPTESSFDQNGINVNNPVIISEIKNSSILPSGSVFKPEADVDWLFIPLNYKHSIRERQFEKALSNYGLTLEDVDTIDKIDRSLDIVRKAYCHVDGDLNTNSLILFSGTTSESCLKCYNSFHHFFFFNDFNPNVKSGCLYMGDVDLNQPDIVDDINIKFRHIESNIGTLQIPHHGSIYNFNQLILKKTITCAVFSFGINNSYGHPSDRVIGDVITSDITPFLVTENPDSIVIQW